MSYGSFGNTNIKQNDDKPNDVIPTKQNLCVIYCNYVYILCCCYKPCPCDNDNYYDE